MQKKTAFAIGEYYPLIKQFSQANWLFIMKLSVCCVAFLIFSLTLFASSSTSGQSIKDKRIAFQIDNQSLKYALGKLQDESGFGIFYSSTKIRSNRNISIDEKSRSVAELLDLLLAGTNLDYHQDGNTIILTEKKNPSRNPGEIIAQHITGTVVDENGKTLPGATVRLNLDKAISSTTDANGLFQIDVKNDQDFLIISFVGYQTQELSVQKLITPIRIRLEPSSGSLNEVQVIGYGTTTKRLSTSSVASITSEDLSKETVENPIQALAGRIAGLQITQTNGNPGSNSSVQVRGVNNLTSSYGLSSAQPLIVIDGIPSNNLTGTLPLSDNLNITVVGANGGLSLFAGLNPQDIERVDVLKDADGTAIYGSRGANGVILITTKRGKAGTSKFTANVYSGYESVGHFVPVLNTPQYLQLRKEAFVNDGITPTASNAPDLLTWDQNGYTDWQKLLIGGTSRMTDAQGSYSGGNDRVQFFASGNYHHEGSVYLGNHGDTRLIGRLNLSITSADKRFKTNFAVSYTDEQTTLPSVDVTGSLYLPPNLPLRNPDGSIYWYNGFTNPLGTLTRQYGSSTQLFIANANLDYSFLTGFHFKLNAGYTRNELNQFNTNPITAQNPTSGTNLVNGATFATPISTNYIVEPQLDYSYHTGKHNFMALLGSTFQKSTSASNTEVATGYAFGALLNSLGAAGTYTAISTYSQYKYAAAFGRLNYNFDDKYLLNVTFRRDASSRFGPNHEFANFGAVGAAWVFSDEKFIKGKNEVLSFGKLRASYGNTGNDQLPNYQYLALFNAGVAYQGSAALKPNGVANPDLEWESTRKLDVGVDLGFFKDRLLLTVDAYIHHSGNLLTYGNLPFQTGSNTINENLDAVVQNKGYEFTITSTNIQSANFKWASNFNISFQTTKMLSFNAQTTAYYGSSFQVGYPVPPTYYYAYGGVNPATGAVVLKDLNNDGAVNTADRYPAGIANPYYGGLNNTFTFKQFSFNFFLQFNNSTGILNQVIGTRPGSLNNQNISVLNRWTKTGDTNTLFPAASSNPGGTGVVYASYPNYGSSDVFYGNAFWTKLRSANLTYSVPQQLTGKWGITNAHIFLQGQNLITWTKQKYLLDPETGNALPPLRTIVAGINFTF